MKKLLLAAATACLLAGCYQSKVLLLDLGQAVHPFADGTWVGDDEEKTSITLKARGNAYVMVDGDSRRDVVMTPLPGRDDAWAAAQAEEGCAEHGDRCEWEYAVVVAEGDGMREILPNCENDWTAMSADTSERNKDGDICWFDDPGKLAHALAYVAGSKNAAMTYRKQ